MKILSASLTTLVTQPLPQKHFTTLDELFDNEFSIKTNIFIQPILVNLPKYQRAVALGKATIMPDSNITASEGIQIFQCEVIMDFMRTKKPDNYYVLPQPLVTFYSSHEMGLMNPYTEDFQNLVNDAYSAGLNHAWETFAELNDCGACRRKESENNFELLKFEDILPFFWILVVGHLGSFLIFLLEIFAYKHLSKISRETLRKKFCSFMRRTRQTRVRRIQVQPINANEM